MKKLLGKIAERKSTEQDRNEINEQEVKSKKNADSKKEVSCKEKKWTCEDTPLWRIFMKSYIEEEKKLEKADKFDRRQPAKLKRFPNVESSEDIHEHATYPCLPLNTLNQEAHTILPNRLNRQEKIRIWKNMKNDPAVDTSSFPTEQPPELSRTDSGKWPGLWPCIDRDLAGERRELERKKKRRGLLPCQESEEESDLDQPRDDFADHKELGHARIPQHCDSISKTHVIDRSTGKRPGLVDGDYIVFFFDNKNDARDAGNDDASRTYADVCLRGMKGMHLRELSDERIRKNTWKFCFYQAVVALLAKTQLRYKFAWSINIDYIFDHAWMLFVHMGSLKVRHRLRLDDVVVYNYKYSVELELVHEMKDVPAVRGAGWNYAEKDFRSAREFERPELMKTRESIGWKKPVKPDPPPVHELTRALEKWFDELPELYRHCILRTYKFSIAFWKDGTFWYMFNPFRCDQFGMFDDEGYACILKFSSKVSLRRHLMILLLRAYSYKPKSPLSPSKPEEQPKEQSEEPPKEQPEETKGHQRKSWGFKFRTNSKQDQEPDDHDKSPSNQEDTGETFTVQIYRMLYHCVQIHNVKLLQRKPPGPKMERIPKKEIDDCGLDPLAATDTCGTFDDMDEKQDDDQPEIEKISWLKTFKISWTRFAKKKNGEGTEEHSKLRWHQYYVEEPLRVYSLWGEIHPTGHMFSRENRGKQTLACYIVSSGMTRIQAPEYWSPRTLDAIVMCGDRYYTMSRLELLNISQGNKNIDPNSSHGYLSKYFKIGETMFELEILDEVCGRLYDKRGKNLWKIVEQIFLQHHFAILDCESSSLGIFKFCGSYYMLDVNSFGPPLFQYGNGVSYLIRATSYQEFIKVIILTINSNECSRFSVTPIAITKMIDLGTTDIHDRTGKIRIRKINCPYEDDKDSKKKSRDQTPVRRSTINQVSCKRPGGGCS